MKSYRASSTFVRVDPLFHELLPFVQNLFSGMVADLNLLGSVGDLYCFCNTLSMLVSILFQPEVVVSNPQKEESKVKKRRPFDLAIDPYARTVYWTCSIKNSINITRLDGKPVGVVVVDQKPRYIALNPDQG